MKTPCLFCRLQGLNRLEIVFPNKSLNMAKWYLPIFCITVVATDMVLAQAISLSGEIIEQSSNTPLELANVVLFDHQQEQFVTGAITDSLGKFNLQLDTGVYYLEISFVGYETKRTDIFVVTADEPKVDLGKIPIGFGQLLSEIEISASKAQFNFALDRKVYNVAKDIFSQTASATEILQNLPSVSVDVNGAISLRGSGDITYLVNGRPSALARTNPTDFLKSLPANTIDYIEVMTNPSAKYRPDGMAGIINIVLKKETNKGLNGTLLANAGNLERFSTNLNLNWSTDHLNIYSGYAFRHALTPESLRDLRISKDRSGKILSTSENNSIESKDASSHLLIAGLDLSISENSQMNISGNYSVGRDDVVSNSNWLVEREVNSEFVIDRRLEELEKEFELNFSFDHEFDEEDHSLAVEFAYAAYKESEDNFYDENYYLPINLTSNSHNLIEKSGPLAELSVEYAKPTGEDSELELGYVGTFLEDDIRFLGEIFSEQTSEWNLDHQRTRQFLFTQSIHSLYTTYGHTISDFSFLLGFRAEQALITSRLRSENREIPNNYFRIYPTIHLGYELDDDQELALSYSRRVNRADSDEHNPFAEYEDPRNREVGNPKLKPELIHSMEFGYRWQGQNFSILPSVYYRHKYDAFTRIQEIVEDSILQTRYVNLASESSAGLELIFTTNFNDILGINLSSDVFYRTLDASNLGYSDKNSIVSWQSKLAINGNFTRSSFFQVNAQYRSARLTPQGKYRPMFLLNVGLRQDILRNRASLILTVSDVFASLQWKRIIDTPVLFQLRQYRRNRQLIYLGAQYRFGQRFKESGSLDFEDTL